MALPVPKGDEKYWINGIPFDGIQTSNNPNTMKFWQDGVTIDFIQPIGAKKSSFILMFE